MWCDGRRRVDLEPGARLEVRRGALPVLLARLRDAAAGPAGGDDGGGPFTDRLVAKFGLPVAGWRGRGAARRENDAREPGGRRAPDSARVPDGRRAPGGTRE
jgi:hypothetical protein